MQELKKSALYVVGTPIGNLEDFSPRAQQTLREADFIAAEDTRVTIKLLNRFEIKKPMISYFEHNKLEHGELIVARILKGESCALVSDAGMPAISDPGETLVKRCADMGIPVYVVPGPTALISALAVSGLPTGRFTFEGFLSMNKNNRREHLLSLVSEQRTMIFYEAPHKLCRTLSDMKKTFGERKIAIVREITKIHEEVIRTDFSGAIKLYREKEPKGEFVIVIEGAKEEEKPEITFEEAVEKARELVESGLSSSEAAREAAKACGFRKGEIYKAIQS